MSYILISAKLKCRRCDKIFKSDRLVGYCSVVCKTPLMGRPKPCECVCRVCNKLFMAANPTSRCPDCKMKNSSVENIPLSAEFLQRARSVPIDIDRLLMELFNEQYEDYKKISLDIIDGVLSLLFPKEEFVLRGLFGIPNKTLNAVGVEIGNTRERVRQIRDKALRRLKHPSRMAVLKGLPPPELSEEEKALKKDLDEYLYGHDALEKLFTEGD